MNMRKLIPFLILGCFAHSVLGQDVTPSHAKFFENEVRPLLAKRCYECHSDAKSSGDLRLDSFADLMHGGESGEPAIVPGKPDESMLIDAVNYESLEMPPDEKLSDREIQTLTRWVSIGAPWPGVDPNAPLRKRERFDDNDRAWWAIQPLTRPQVPRIARSGWTINPIDHFIADRMLSNGLSPAREATKTELVRRLYLDVTGLPPTPDQVTAFLEDESPDGYEKLVDSLLDSKGYGEHAARQWLDLVRYADSDGYRADGFRPQAWRYRDYVVRSFNNDKPYDRFVQEQLAGDEMFPGDLDAQVALGYLRHWVYEWNIRDAPTQWNTIIEDLTDTTADVFMGLGLQCAKCHNHKFDPLLQQDYFRLRAFFAPIMPRDIAVATAEEIARHDAKRKKWEEKTATIREQIAAIEQPYRDKYRDIAIDRFPEDIQAIARTPENQRTGYEDQLTYLVQRQVEAEHGRLNSIIKGEDKERLVELRRKLKAFDSLKPKPLPTAMSVTEVIKPPPPTTIPKFKNKPIEPGVPAIMEASPLPIVASPSLITSGRRTTLARWLTMPDNPLTARVIANRIWQSHFGRGLAENTSDFGILGGPPSHPELLDWLATELVKDNWSLKSLHRKILLSATYRQSTQHSEFTAFQQIDPANEFYWRHDTTRLSAEQIRDSLLVVCGRMKNRNGGGSVHADSPYRSIYTRQMRNSPDQLLNSFDLPQFFSSNSSRNTTTTPIQSLLLFNSDQMLSYARSLAELVSRQSSDLETRVAIAWRRTFGRDATPDELRASLAFIAGQTSHLRSLEKQRSEQEEDQTLIETSKLPYRDGQAIRFQIDDPSLVLSIRHAPELNLSDFTIETFFQLRSIASSGSVRSIVSKWNAKKNPVGWNFGVTGKGSRRKPQTLVMHMFGQLRSGKLGEAAVFSDQHIALDTPYYASASVRLATDDKPGKVTFFLKDLSNDDEPLQIAEVAHNISEGIANEAPISIGRRSGTGASEFDGLVDDVRLVSRAIQVDEILQTVERDIPGVVGYWQFEVDPGVRRNSASDKHGIMASGEAIINDTPEEGALVDFCHALLNSNEFLYVN
ncbi:DUF1553 domain-containing protein [Rhodopirellula sallentina]|uniref:Secreted protein containing DUF1549 n=1 Tax=Rhodopirellula sallentina SM41 TaxID=1263870 RepID=M5TV46_9BACT|nr:DUF1553 domain-containing protein [Rhodopirellula sallentina]EMI53067.1 secreted protein containing DUF1549 [Rhodopirellula sallentina SM41]